MRIRRQITHRMMYGFAFICAQCGLWKEKTEMTVVRVGSNLNTLRFILTTIFGAFNILVLLFAVDNNRSFKGDLKRKFLLMQMNGTVE